MCHMMGYLINSFILGAIAYLISYIRLHYVTLICLLKS